MKKGVLIIASAMIFLLCACGGKNDASRKGGSARDLDTQWVMQDDEDSDDGEFTIRDLYTVTVPDGWKAQHNETNAIMELLDEKGQSKVRIALMICDDRSIEESAQDDGLKLKYKIGEIGLGDIRWTVFRRQERDPKDFGAFVAVPSINGCIYAKCFSQNGFDENLKKGLASIKLK